MGPAEAGHLLCQFVKQNRLIQKLWKMASIKLEALHRTTVHIRLFPPITINGGADVDVANGATLHCWLYRLLYFRSGHATQSRGQLWDKPYRYCILFIVTPECGFYGLSAFRPLWHNLLICCLEFSIGTTIQFAVSLCCSAARYSPADRSCTMTSVGNRVTLCDIPGVFP